MYNYFKSTIGHKIAGMNVEENVLFAWSYYFLNIADESKETGNNVMVNMLRHFDSMMSSDNIKIDSNSEENRLLLLDETFCRTWFKTSICGMIAHLYGEENVMKALTYLDEEYFIKNTQYRTMMLNNIDKTKQAN